MTAPAKTKDYDVRAAVVAALLDRGVPRRDIRHEITLDTASIGGRADVVVLRNKGISGIEIKSGSDKLDRLRDQIERYNQSFDYVHVVADKLHRDGVDVAARCFSDVVFWCPETEEFMFPCYQLGLRGELRSYEPGLGPGSATRSRATSILSMALLMWRNEAVRVSQKLGGPRGTRESVIDWMRENARLCDVRPLVIEELRARIPNRWEDAFWLRFNGVREDAK